MKKRYIPYLFGWITLIAISLTIQNIKPIYINENQILYLFSAASQIIAAVYGLIITGYIFLRNELDRKVSDDESLEEIVKCLKDDYYTSIIYISFITLASITLCFISISLETHPNILLLNIMINISVATILLELVVIVFFVIKILNPNSFEMASNKIVNNTYEMKTGNKGSLEKFLYYYNQIEYILDKYGNAYIDIKNNEEPKYRKNNIAKTKLVYIIFNEGKITDRLKHRLIELISFRNSLIHGTDLSVSENAVKSAKEIFEELEEVLCGRKKI